MYHTCLHCTADLGANDVLETLPIGRQIAFDSHQGRLWVVCSKCAKWNLVPFDDRLETIDACEKLFRDTKTRYSTEHIGLAKLSEGLSLVRIGSPDGHEFASWRYGMAFQRRRLKTRLVAGAIVAPPTLLLVVPRLIDMGMGGPGMFGIFGVASGLFQGVTMGMRFAKSRRLRLKIRGPDGELRTLVQKDLRAAEIKTTEADVRLEIFSGEFLPHKVVDLHGADADQLIGRILGKLNATHGTTNELNEAVNEASRFVATEQIPSLTELIGRSQVVNRRGWGSIRFADIVPERRLAFEMWGNEASEKEFLSGQLKLLERQWREAEELAKLADGLALPETSDADLERLRNTID